MWQICRSTRSRYEGHGKDLNLHPSSSFFPSPHHHHVCPRAHLHHGQGTFCDRNFATSSPLYLICSASCSPTASNAASSARSSPGSRSAASSSLPSSSFTPPPSTSRSVRVLFSVPLTFRDHPRSMAQSNRSHLAHIQTTLISRASPSSPA